MNDIGEECLLTLLHQGVDVPTRDKDKTGEPPLTPHAAAVFASEKVRLYPPMHTPTAPCHAAPSPNLPAREPATYPPESLQADCASAWMA